MTGFAASAAAGHDVGVWYPDTYRFLHRNMAALIQKIASDRNPSIAMMNLVDELLTPDDVPAYGGVPMD